MIKLKSKKFYQTNNYYGVSLNVRKREKKSSRKISDSQNTRLLQLLSFALPILILLGYFAYRKMFPFGNSSILTVDLGQQYVDFLFRFIGTHCCTISVNFSIRSKMRLGAACGEHGHTTYLVRLT